MLVVKAVAMDQKKIDLTLITTEFNIRVLENVDVLTDITNQLDAEFIICLTVTGKILSRLIFIRNCTKN